MAGRGAFLVKDGTLKASRGWVPGADIREVGGYGDHNTASFQSISDRGTQGRRRVSAHESPRKIECAECSKLARALVHGLLRAADDKSVRTVVLITGVGRAFCAGGDLERLRDMRNRRAVAEFQMILVSGKELCLAIANMPKLVVAAMNGPAAGAGMSLALACDLRIASEIATFHSVFSRTSDCTRILARHFFCRGWWGCRALPNFFTRRETSPLPTPTNRDCLQRRPA